jgi:exonuclease VII large subunit
MEREKELRELQETLEQTRQEYQAWKHRLKALESHLHEQEEKIKEREHTLENALQYSRALGVIPEQQETSSLANVHYDEDNVVAPSRRVPTWTVRVRVEKVRVGLLLTYL